MNRFTSLALAAALAALTGCGGHKAKSNASTAAGSTAAPVQSNSNAPVTSGFALPEARAEHQAVVLKSGEILVIGGVDALGNPLNTTLLVRQNDVVPGPDLSEARAGHSATLLPSGQVLVAGGHSDASGATVLGTSEVFDPLASAFNAGPALNEARSGHAAVLVGSEVLLVGGTGASGAPLDSAEWNDPAGGNTRAVKGSLSVAQTGLHGALLSSGEVVVGGGIDATGAPGAVELFDPINSVFTPLTAQGRAGAAVAAVGSGTALIAGGETATGIQLGSEVTWHNGAAVAGPGLLAARRDLEAAVLPGNVFAFVGGWDGNVASDAIEVGIAPLGTGSLTAGPALSEARFGHSVSVRGTETLVVIGGWASPGNALATIEQVRITPPVSTTPPSRAPNPKPIPNPIPAPGPVIPPGAISTFPYSEDFDAGMGGWKDVTTDDFDWSTETGSTSSLDTGPNGDHTGGGTYLFTESSSPNSPSKVAILEGPTFAGFNSLEVRFWFHMYGATMGDLFLDVSTDNGQTWDQGVWNMSGNQGNRWTEATADLSQYAPNPVMIRFRAVTGTSFTSDFAIDDITVDTTVRGPAPAPGSTPITTFPYTESFDAGATGPWLDSVADDFDWSPNTGSTTSTGTGPTAGRGGSGGYLYTESSSPNSPNKVAILEGPTFGGFGANAELRFWYHMEGATMGQLDLEVSTDAGQTWTSAWSMSGDQGSSWLEAVVDMSSYAGQNVKIRFRGETGTSYTSDMAIDELSFTN